MYTRVYEVIKRVICVRVLRRFFFFLSLISSTITVRGFRSTVRRFCPTVSNRFRGFSGRVFQYGVRSSLPMCTVSVRYNTYDITITRSIALGCRSSFYCLRTTYASRAVLKANAGPTSQGFGSFRRKRPTRRGGKG